MTQNILLSPISIDELESRLITRFVQEMGILLKPTSVPDNSFLTRKKTAEILGISLPTLNEYTKTGIVKGYKIGSRIRYKKQEIQDSLQGIHQIRYKR